VTGALNSEPRAQSPEQALRAIGVRCTVETRGSLAVVIPAPGERSLEDAAVRRAVLAALRSCGFTHAAVEPYDERQSATTSDAPMA
jgi:hypothetical protein